VIEVSAFGHLRAPPARENFDFLLIRGARCRFRSGFSGQRHRDTRRCGTIFTRGDFPAKPPSRGANFDG
jgi:hypothetical protein